MARRTTYQEPKKATLNIAQMQHGIVRLEKLIKEIEAFDPQAIQKRSSTEVKTLETNIEGVLTWVFGHDTVEYQTGTKVRSRLDQGPVIAMPFYVGGGGGLPHHDNAHEARLYVSEGKERSIQLLRQAINWLQDELVAQGQTTYTVDSDHSKNPKEIIRLAERLHFVVRHSPRKV